MANAIMIQGTASNAGKSLLAAGLCRIFAQDGYKVAPFKSQNMALNSAITPDGFEMGRAQVVQSEAAGVAPDVRMNPILLKPTSHVGSQVIVNGVPRGTMAAGEYFRYRKSLIPEVMAAYESLAAEYDIIVIEGAGSPAEINLRQDDIVNMGMARRANAPVLLCGDIDRGGVFASLYGTVKLLEPDEQARIKGLIINKFRGDVDILRPGLGELERLSGKPVLGVVPMLDVDVDDEDSFPPPERRGKGGPGGHCGGAPAPPVQLHRLQPPGADGGGHPPLRPQSPGAGAPRSGAPPRHQEHHGRSALAAGERHGGRRAQARLGRRSGDRHLWRLSDAGEHRLRPRRGGGGRLPPGPGPAPSRHGVPGGEDPHPGDGGLPRPGGALPRLGRRGLRGLRDPHGPHRERRPLWRSSPPRPGSGAPTASARATCGAATSTASSTRRRRPPPW